MESSHFLFYRELFFCKMSNCLPLKNLFVKRQSLVINFCRFAEATQCVSFSFRQIFNQIISKTRMYHYFLQSFLSSYCPAVSCHRYTLLALSLAHAYIKSQLETWLSIYLTKKSALSGEIQLRIRVSLNPYPDYGK